MAQSIEILCRNFCSYLIVVERYQYSFQHFVLKRRIYALFIKDVLLLKDFGILCRFCYIYIYIYIYIYTYNSVILMKDETGLNHFTIFLLDTYNIFILIFLVNIIVTKLMLD